MTAPVKKYIEEFKNKCEYWEKKYPKYKFIFNSDLYKIEPEKIKYILVADNPGNKEADIGRYLTGDAGILARLFFERYFVNNFEKEMLVLNKTPIYTNITGGLKNINTDILKETQEYMVSMIVNLYKLINKPVIISGFAGCRKSGGGFLDINSENKDAVGKYFFSKLKDEFKNKRDDLYIIKHFSRMSIFSDFTIEIYDKLTKNDDFNILTEIGKKYREELFK